MEEEEEADEDEEEDEDEEDEDEEEEEDEAVTTERGGTAERAERVGFVRRKEQPMQ
jgi:hypothetical protein